MFNLKEAKKKKDRKRKAKFMLDENSSIYEYHFIHPLWRWYTLGHHPDIIIKKWNFKVDLYSSLTPFLFHTFFLLQYFIFHLWFRKKKEVFFWHTLKQRTQKYTHHIFVFLFWFLALSFSQHQWTNLLCVCKWAKAEYVNMYMYNV